MTRAALPPEHFTLLDEAIKDRFKQSWQALERLSQGLSGAVLYKLEIGEKVYIARLSDPNDPHQNLEREFAAMQLAAKEEIAPQVYYANSQTGLVLMDYIEPASFSAAAFREAGRVECFAQMLRKVHEGEPFLADSSMFEKVEAIYALLPEDLQEGDLFRQGLALKQRLEPLLSDSADLKPCHCDINPTNVLWDGKRFWLIDWGLASEQNFYFDLACWVNFFGFYSERLAKGFLEAYFGRELNSVEQEKFKLMQVFVSVFYGFIFSYFASMTGERLSTEDLARLEAYAAFMAKLGSGEENLAQLRSRLKLGAIYLKKAMTEAQALPKLQSSAA